MSYNKIASKKAYVYNAPSVLRAAKGSHNSMAPTVIKSNTSWRLRLRSGGNWLQLPAELTGSTTKGDGVLMYTYNALAKPTGDTGDVREAKIDVLEYPSNKVLDTVIISQATSPAAAFFSEGYGNPSKMQEDMVLDTSARTVYLNVFSDGGQKWNLVYADNPNMPMFGTVSASSGTANNRVSVVVKAAEKGMEREGIFYLFDDSGNLMDEIKITQAGKFDDEIEDDKTATIAAVSGAPGYWNANARYARYSMKVYDLLDNEWSAGAAHGGVRSMRESMSGNTVGSGYTIQALQKDVKVTPTDSGGNSYVQTGSDYNRNTNNYYRDGNEDEVHATIELGADASNIYGVQTSLLTEKVPFYSKEGLDAIVNSDAGAVFTSFVKLTANTSMTVDEANGTPSTAKKEAASRCTVQLWNIFDPKAANPSDTVPNVKFDSVDVEEVGNFKLGSQKSPYKTSAERLGGFRLFNLFNSLKIGFQVAYIKTQRTVTEVVLDVVAPVEKPMTLTDSAGEDTVEMSYSYTILSVKTSIVPADLMFGVGYTGARGRVMFNDVMEIKMKFTSLAKIGGNIPEIKDELLHSPTSFKVRIDLDRKNTIDKWLNYVAAFILAVVSFIALIITFGGAAALTPFVAAAMYALLAYKALAWLANKFAERDSWDAFLQVLAAGGALYVLYAVAIIGMEVASSSRYTYYLDFLPGGKPIWGAGEWLMNLHVGETTSGTIGSILTSPAMKFVGNLAAVVATASAAYEFLNAGNAVTLATPDIWVQGLGVSISKYSSK